MHPALTGHNEDRTFGERAADTVVRGIGTWTFLIVQFAFMVCWILGNVYVLRHVGTKAFDPYPFILLNLCLSVQAAVTGPLLLLAGNRQAAKDRDLANHDFDTNVRALELLVELHTGKAPPHPLGVLS